MVIIQERGIVSSEQPAAGIRRLPERDLPRRADRPAPRPADVVRRTGKAGGTGIAALNRVLRGWRSGRRGDATRQRRRLRPLGAGAADVRWRQGTGSLGRTV